jgi:hypothetical protein
MIPNFEESSPGIIVTSNSVSFELHGTFPISTIAAGLNLP